MTHPVIPEYNRSRKIAGFVIAVASAAVTPFLAGFCTTIIFPTIICTLLYGFSGLWPAVTAMLLQVFVFGLLGGLPFSLIALVGMVLPAAFMIRNLRWRVPFFKQLANGIAAQALGMVAVLAVARVFYGTDLPGKIAGMFRTVFETFLTPGFIDYILDMVYQIDAIPDSLTESELIQGVLDATRRTEYLDGLTTEIAATLRLTLPGTLLSASCLTGLLAVTWPAKLIDKNIPVSGAYVKLARWYTPWWISLGMIGLWTITWILELIGVGSSDVLYLTVQSLLLMVFRVQATISLERRFTQFNMQPVLRVIAIIALHLLLPADIVMFYGAFSALFGTNGAALQIRILRGKDNNNNNNPGNNNIF